MPTDLTVLQILDHLESMLQPQPLNGLVGERVGEMLVGVGDQVTDENLRKLLLIF